MTANPRSHLLTARSSPPMRFRTCEDAHGKATRCDPLAQAAVANTGAPLTMCYEDGFIGYSGMRPVAMSPSSGAVPMQAIPTLTHAFRAFAGQMGVEYDRRRGAFIPTGSDVLLERDGVYFLVTRRASSRLLPGRASTMRCIPHVYSRTHLSTRRATVRSCSPSSPRYDVSTSYAASSSIRASCTVASSWPMPHPTVPNAP